MKVAVLGANETALVALDAIESRGDMQAILVIPWDHEQDFKGVNIMPSPLNELNFGYPGVEESAIRFEILPVNGNWEKQRKGLVNAGFHAFEGMLPRTSSQRIFESIRYRLSVTRTILWIPGEKTLREVLDEYEGGVDAIINTEDRARFCAHDDEHTFLITRVFYSTVKGPKIQPDTVVYNPGTDMAWAITSDIDGRRVTIWEHQPPFDDVEYWDIPTKTTCTCETAAIDLHVGPWATYRPTSPARSYEEIVEFLHHPMVRLTGIGFDPETAFGEDNEKCPTCGSPNPLLHPAVEWGGEVTNICEDPFHGQSPSNP